MRPYKLPIFEAVRRERRAKKFNSCSVLLRGPQMIFELNPSSVTPLFRQLYNELRAAILDHRLPAGTRLPSTRQMAEDLSVSRNTVLNAYEQLIAEGYIYGRTGSGNYVAKLLDTAPVPPKSRAPRLSKRGKLLAKAVVTSPSVANAKISFRPGKPALEKFPFTYWSRLLGRTLNQLRPRDFHYSDPAGYRPFREAITRYLSRNRGVRCSADQVVIVNGSQQAMDLCCKVLLNPGEIVWMEDPGYKGARAAFAGAQGRIVSVPVDSEGLQWKRLRDRIAPRFIYITPSHQFPTGVTMSLQRRLSLLEVAGRKGAWILEDDYDSEFRYDGRPLAALQGLDQNDRVLYIGTFSKVMYAGLRLGYLVVPRDLISAFIQAKAVTDRHCAILEQAALTEFLNSGRFERHIRNMRKLYATRQKKLIDSVNSILNGLVEIVPSPAGMHLVGSLRRRIDDRVVSSRAAEHGVEVPALSSYASRAVKPGLLLGYAGLTPQQISLGIIALKSVMRQL